MMPYTYMQVIAQHRSISEQLLLRSPDGLYYLWFGAEGTLEAMEETDPRLAHWMEAANLVDPLPEPRFWIHVDDLPLAPATTERSLPRG